MTDETGDPQRLARALEIALEWREGGDATAVELLERHPDLSDLLEVLLADPAAEAVEPGELLGDFRLEAELGRGSMGVVYLAEQRSLGRRVALKVMQGGAAATARQIARFRREAALTARLEHRHVVRLLEFGVVDERPFFAMEVVDGAPLNRVYQAIFAGQTLRAAVTTMTGEDSTWPADHFRGLARLGGQVARGLQHAHERGVVHRDVKPSNILVRPSGDAQLADFGIARERDVPSMTATGEFAGTPHYVSPEQVRGGTVDGRADVFSLGSTIYEGLTHCPPFDAGSSVEVVQRILQSEPRDPRSVRRDVPRDLAAIVMKALEKSPAHRYREAAEMAADLEAFADGRPVRARPLGAGRRALRWARRSPLKVALAASALAAAGLSFYLLSIQPDAELGASARRRARVDELVERGYVQAAKGSARAADRSFAAALELDPDRGDAWVGWALAWLEHQQPDDALALLDRAPRLADPEAQRSLDRTRALVLRANGRLEDAARIERRLGACRTDFEWFAVGLDHLVRGHHSGQPPEFVAARQCLDRAIALASGPNPMFQCQRAHVAGHLFDRADAELWARILLDQWPDSPHATFFAAFALRPFDRERALDLHRRAVALPDAEPLHAVQLADALRGADQLTEAVAALRAAGKRWPDSALLDFRRGEALRLAGQSPAARAAYEVALAKGGDRALAGEFRGVALLRLGRHEAAREWLERRVREAPRGASGWVLLSLTFITPGDFAGGAAVLRRAVAAIPQHRGLQLRLADCLQRAGQSEQACVVLRRCVDVDPAAAVAWDRLSQLLVRLGRVDEAGEVLDRALEQAGVLASSVCRRANIHRARDEFSAARVLYDRAIEIRNDYPDAYFHRAVLEMQDGADREAAEWFRKAVEKGPRLVGPAREGARLFDRLGDVVTMKDFCRRAVLLQPKDRSLHEQLVEAFSRRGLTQELEVERERWASVTGR